jgi:Uncharacterised nucleotidyltransferase
MILVAGTAAARAASRPEAQALTEVADWTALEHRLRAQRLLALLGDRIIAVAEGRAPGKFVEAAGASVGTGRGHDAALELITIQLTDSLTTAGIQSLPLKAPMLGRAIHGDAGLRRSADIDLLVSSDDLPGAVAVAERLGYRDRQGFAARGERPRLHVTLTRQGLPPLELHWRVHWYESRFSRDLLTRSTEAGQLGRRAIPIHEMIADYPELTRALVAATVVAERVVAVPGRELLSREHAPERRVRLAMALANPDSHGSVKQRTADTWLIDWLLTPRGGRRECIRRQLRAPSDSPRGPHDGFASPGRGAQLLRRYAISVVRVAGDRLRRRSYSVTSRP